MNDLIFVLEKYVLHQWLETQTTPTIDELIEIFQIPADVITRDELESILIENGGDE